jgi:3-methyladenine DNA glycosylase AlkD
MLSRGERDKLVRETLAEIATLKFANTPALRGLRRALSAKLRQAEPADVKAVALGLKRAGRRWMGCEIINQHRGALESLTVDEIEAMGEGMASWDHVDAFGVLLSGAAWQRGRISDLDVRRWAKSKDLWWRRAALVSTVPLNMRSRGGRGDVKRTLAIAEMLAADHEDMVVKAMSWALRELVEWDRKALQAFMAKHDDVLAARVKREVRNKMTTGLKTPKAKR